MAMELVSRSMANKERFWQGHVEAWQRSSRSQRDYCDRKGLSLSTFTVWRQRLNGAAAGRQVRPTGPAMEIVPVRPVSRNLAAPVVVVLGGGQYRVELNEGFRPEMLRAVVIALEGRP